MVFNFEVVGLVLSLIWLIVLSYFLWRNINHYDSLTKGITDKTLTSILERLVTQVHITHKDTQQLKARCDTIEKQSVLYIQKIGLMRFNPFKDTGGDQSFILSFLDSQNSGVVISGLYSRSGTRWYAKRVVKGKGIDHELSEDEKKAIATAK